MLGAKELGITIEWQFEFLGYGRHVQPQLGTIFVELGSKLDYGIIDHHIKDSAYASTASAIVDNSHLVSYHLLGPLNETYYHGLALSQKTIQFNFVGHDNPDWDCMASFFLCQYIGEHGHLPPEHICRSLAQATDIIDQGEVKIGSHIFRPFLIYLMMMSTCTNWADRLKKGVQLIEHLIGTRQICTPELFLDPFDPPPLFSAECRELLNDQVLFQNDLLDSEEIELQVPTHDSVAVQTKALIFARQPECKLHKYWIREHNDIGILLIPFENEDHQISRVVISVDPASNFSLQGLGYMLEKAESKRRVELNRLRRGKPRFEVEYCDNDDPWYDGRGHHYTIVDSPRIGTVLSYQEILAVVRSLYQQNVRQLTALNTGDGFISYRREGGTDLALAIKVFLESNGKKIFMDIESLKAGRFPEQLVQMITAAKNFILILSPRALERCNNEQDWMRQEIVQAIRTNKNIIPVLMEGFLYPNESEMPGEMSELPRYHGLRFVNEQYYASFRSILNNMQ